MGYFSVGFFGGAGAPGDVTISGNYVTLDTEQTITATKTFDIDDALVFLDTSSSVRIVGTDGGTFIQRLVDASWVDQLKFMGDGDIQIPVAVRLKNRVLNRTANGQELAEDTGSTVTNKGATDAITLELPAAAAGLTFEFVREADYNMSIVPAAGDIIRSGTTNVTDAGSIDLNAVGSTITVRAIDGDTWIVLSKKPTIPGTDSPPDTKTANHTIVAADVGKTLFVENAADREVTLGDLSVGDWPIGETLAIVRAGTGEVDLLASGAVVLKSTLGSGEDVRIPDEWGLIVVYRKAENDYLVSGAVAEVPE